MTKTLEPHSRVKLQKEIAIFLGVTGFLLGAAAYATFTMLAGKGLPLWGMARNLAIGMPLAILSATGKFPINLISGAIIAIPLVLWPRVWAYRKA